MRRANILLSPGMSGTTTPTFLKNLTIVFFHVTKVDLILSHDTMKRTK